MKVIREPMVYLVGRQQVDDAAIERLLSGHGLSWQADTEAGAERLVEAGGRACRLSFGKERRSNAEYIGNRIERLPDGAEVARAGHEKAQSNARQAISMPPSCCAAITGR